MESAIQGIKDVWATMVSLGYQPMPLLLACLVMLAARSYWEPSVLSITTKEEMKQAGLIKIAIFFATFFINGLIQIGLARPAMAFDWCLSVGFSLGNVFVAYVVSSSAVVRNYLATSLFKKEVVPTDTNKPSV